MEMSATLTTDIPDHVVNELCGTIQMMTIQLIKDLLSKWNEMYGLSEDEKQRRLQKLTDYLQGFYNDISQSEEVKRIELLEKVDNKMKEYFKLQKDLALTDEIHQLEVRSPYSEFIKEIDKSMTRFLEEKEKRIDKARRLRSEEQELCMELGLPVMHSFPNPIPTEQQLDDMQLKLFELHEEKINRLRIYKNTRAVIIKLTNLLEREPVTQLEKDIKANSEEHFQPSTENMKWLENLKNILEKQQDDTIKRRQDLIERLTKLWDRLKVVSDDREIFLAQNNTISKSHIFAIEMEIDRCEQLKRENMRQVIETTRDKISELWDKVTYTQEQRQQFTPFLTDHYTEDVLDLHELEIDRLELFYLTNQNIFELADKRNSLWERMLHLDELAQDKARLFSNRGGQLLKEEKERKDLEVNLPKVDKQLKTALVEYGQPFLWHGKDLLKKITEDWEERLISKKSHKLTRKIGYNKPLGTEDANIYGSRSATKQKRLAVTPLGGGYTKLRRCDTEGTTTPKRGVRTPVTLSRTPLNASSSSLASYTQFHEGIEKSVPRAALRDVNNTPGVAHSSPTPVTPRRATPASSKKTPQTVPRLAYCRKRLQIDI